MPMLTLVMLSTMAAAAPPPSATPRPPEKVYGQICGYCHGKNIGPVILGRKLDPDYIKAMARSGPNGMPAFRPTEVSDVELNKLATWISRSKTRKEEHGK